MFRIYSLVLVTLTLTSIAINSHASQILFDQGHAQAFTIEQDGELQLSRFSALLKKTGATVQSTTESLTAERLSPVKALIISGPFRPYTPQEIIEVKAFIHRGGRVVIMLHIAAPMWGLLDALGVDVANGVIRETEGVLEQEPINFRVSAFSPHPLTRGLATFKIYGGWPLRPAAEHAKIIAQTSKRAWVDLNRDHIFDQNDPVQQFGVVVSGAIGDGEFLVFADDAIFQNRFLVEENKALAENLGAWATGN